MAGGPRIFGSERRGAGIFRSERFPEGHWGERGKMTRQGAVRKPRVTADLRAAGYRERKARKLRTCGSSEQADFTRLMRKCRKSLPRTDLRALRYRRRKARKLRTWTFSAGAIFTREIRQGRRGNCYPEVTKHASCARAVSAGRAENFRSESQVWYRGVSK